MGGDLVSHLGCQLDRWECPEPLPPLSFARLRNHLVLNHAKWDPQVGDVHALAPFPLIIPAEEWLTLAQLAERLAAEAIDAERELIERPELLNQLGLPRKVRLALASGRPSPPQPTAMRVFRFDFHPTRDGWRISEANADVPGGYTEASEFPRLMAEHFPGTRTAGHPGAVWADQLKAVLGRPELPVALLSATGYMEDQQVTIYLGGLLRQLGCATVFARPSQIVWQEGRADLQADWY